MASRAIQFQFRKGDKDPVGYWDPPTTASNNWVVDASLSASGKPLLASDPHRAIALPSLRYLVHLHAPGWNVIGGVEPALPGIALGHNEKIAWGITIVTTDQADIFVEKTHPDDPTRYSVGEEWHKMDMVREQIPVKGQAKVVEMELRFTRHGPVIHQNEKKHVAFALKWSGSEPGGAAYLGGLAVSRARDRSEFLKALESWKIPSLNFVYADVEGDIGWVAAGLMPVRKQGDGLLPVPGWTGAYDWQGFLPGKELPQSFNPPRHWLATANHNILPKGYPHQISYEFAPPHRFLRIQQRLDEKKRFDLDDFQNIQHESKSLPGVALAKLLAKIPISDPTVATYAKIIIDWDGVLSRDSAAGVLYAMWLQELVARFYARAGYDRGTTDLLKQLNNISFLLANLEKPTPFWFDTEANADRDEFLRSTLESAAQRATRLLGKDMSKWRWGALHTAAFHHPLEKLGPEYAKAFNLGPVERSGDASTPNNTKHDDDFKQIHGASYRQVFDLADWDRGRATSTPGQSGQLGSPHYGDLLPLWAEGQYFPLAYSRKKVEEVTAHRLTLTPK
jgi:penicillin amidase